MLNNPVNNACISYNRIEELKESLQKTDLEENKLEATTVEVSNIDIKKESEKPTQESKEGNENSDSFVIQEKRDADTTCVIMLSLVPFKFKHS